MKTNLFLLLFAGLFAGFNAFPQASKQVNSVATMADLAARRPVTNEVIEVRSGSATVKWKASRMFLHVPDSSETADGVYVVTNAAGSGRYIAQDRYSGIVDVAHHGAVGDGVTDDTAAIASAISALRDGSTLYSVGSKLYKTTARGIITNSAVTVDFSGSTIDLRYGSRGAAIQIGPNETSITGLSAVVSSATNLVTGVPDGTFAVGDMIFLYDSGNQTPPNYWPGEMAFVTAASGTTITLDRMPATSFTATDARRFVAAPVRGEIRNLKVTMANATDGIGVSVRGRDVSLRNVHVGGTGTTDDPNYIGIELRGQNLSAWNCSASGILDANNSSDRAGYGLFAAGDNVSFNDCDAIDCKHCFSTSERRAVADNVSLLNSRIRQRSDWADVLDGTGAKLFTAAVDVHANVRHVTIKGNDVRLGGQFAMSIRNGNADVSGNFIRVDQQSGLSFNQLVIGFAEAPLNHFTFSENTVYGPDGTGLFYFGQYAGGLTNLTHSHIKILNNDIRGPLLGLSDGSGVNHNEFVDVQIRGNSVSRTDRMTPVLMNGLVRDVQISGNWISYGTNGNGITVAFPVTNSWARAISISGNFFSKDAGGTGYNVRQLTGQTNLVLLGENRWAESSTAYDSPVNGIDAATPVGFYNPIDTYPRIIGVAGGKLKFGSGTSYPDDNTTLSYLFSGAIESTAILGRKGSAETDVALGSYWGGSFQNYWQSGVRVDGLRFWRNQHPTNSATILTPLTVGPQNEAERTNGIYTIGGFLGMIYRGSTPRSPGGDEAYFWLSDPTNKSVAARWIDGTTSTLLHDRNVAAGANITLSMAGGTLTISSSGGGGTNASRVFFNSTGVDSPNFADGPEIKSAVVGTNITLSVKTNSIGTNQLSNSALASLLNRANHTGTQDWTTVTGTPTTLSGYGITDAQAASTILTGIAGLTGNGIMVKTGSGTVTNRTLTGDSEIAVANGDGVAGNPTLSIGSAIARLASPAMTGTPTVNGTNLMAYVAGKQDAATILSAISALAGNGLVARTGSGTVASRTLTGDTEIVVSNGDGASGNPTLSIGAAIARLASPALTGSPTAPTAADGTSNTVVATTAWVLRNAGTGGGGSGNANTNNSQGWAAATTNTFNGDVVFNGAVTVADLIINSATYSGVWGFANGAPGGTNASQTRTILGLEPDIDVQAFRLPLLQLYVALGADGDMPYRNASGIVTNVTSTSAGRTLLAAASAAAQRAAMGVPDIAGDTFTGAIKVPYEAYSSGWTNNTKTNEVPTKRAIAEKIEALSVGGYISSVSTDFEVAGSQLGVTNTLGTGRLVRESATGAATAFNSLSDVSVASRDRGEQAWFDGTNWKNMPLASPAGNIEEWEDAYTSCATSTTQTPFTASAVNTGSSSINPTLWFRQGVYAPTTRLTAVDLFTGSVFAGSATSTWLTNRYIGKIEFVPSFTNATVMIAGYSDRLNQAGLTNAPTDELAVTITNGVMRFVACTASAGVSVASTTYTPATNLWHLLVIQGTNQVATAKVFTNSPTGLAVAWQEAINSANVPNGTSALLGFGFGAYGTGSASTNGTAIALVNQMGYRWQNKGLN